MFALKLHSKMSSFVDFSLVVSSLNICSIIAQKLFRKLIWHVNISFHIFKDVQKCIHFQINYSPFILYKHLYMFKGIYANLSQPLSANLQELI